MPARLERTLAPLQASLFAGGEAAVRPDAPVARRDLGGSSWVDVGRGWLAGADQLFAELEAAVPWRQGRRRMYERVLDDPRLARWYPMGAPLPHPALDQVRLALEDRYGVPFGGVGLNLYRDGRDSVAPHGDRELRELDDTLVAIVTLGAQRPFTLRPRAGGRATDLSPASGDLVVMGGRCQLDWLHGVPKATGAGPRISASWRWTRAGGPLRQRRRR